jgi:hypothetical protein
MDDATNANAKLNQQLIAVNDVFKIPICYNKEVKKLTENIVTDLELINTFEKDETSIYNCVFKPNNKPAAQVIKQFGNYYTTDVSYLKDTQTFISNIKREDINSIYNKHLINDSNIDDTLAIWEEIKGETGFCEKYLYIDWNFAKFMNNNPAFLQLMSIYNIASPILSLCLPIFILIIPFFIIKVKGIELNIKEYIDILKMLISNHSITKIFTQFNTVDFGQKMYLLVSAAFYIFSIYQNILICIRFYSNMKKIHSYLYTFKKYIDFSIDAMEYYHSQSVNLTNYIPFNEVLTQNLLMLNKFKDDINKITPLHYSNGLKKIGEIGHIMHTFYQLYDNPDYSKAIAYSFGFNGYFNMMYEFKTHIDNNKINKTTFTTNKNTKPIFKKMYYPKFINNKSDTIIKNNCNLNKNMIITGPNASGKTTTLKTTLINIILSQQFGYGCFKSGKLTPYDNIHCYLNIPDTSGRDSLFQAEARRCKEIIDCITENDTQSHICILDELYSGTNPEEAVLSAFAFMEYIVKKKLVTCLLTTHYTKLCKKLSKNTHIKNYNMKTIKQNDDFEYTYELIKGISNVKGGLKVLHDLDYPYTFAKGITKH